jgi:hypothetical protein
MDGMRQGGGAGDDGAPERRGEANPAKLAVLRILTGRGGQTFGRSRVGGTGQLELELGDPAAMEERFDPLRGE